MATFTLTNPLQNHRGHSESFKTYKARRRICNRAVRSYLRGDPRLLMAVRNLGHRVARVFA